MYEKMMFTHDDLDGAGCAVLFRLFNSESVRYENWDVVMSPIPTLSDSITYYMDNGLIVPQRTTVYFADICPNVPMAQQLLSMGFDVKIFDHHQTALWIKDLIPDASIVPTSQFGTKESGTSLFYRYACEMAMMEPGHPYFNEKMNADLMYEFVEMIRLYDTYEWKRSKQIRARQLQILFSMLGRDRFCDRYVAKLMNPKEKSLISDCDLDFVTARMESEQRAIDRFTPERAIDLDCRGRRVAFVIGPTGANFSELASQFLEKYREYDAIVNFYLSPNGGSYQIRGRGDLNLADEIARPMGGGGHPGACGAQLPKQFNEALKNIVIDTLCEYHI